MRTKMLLASVVALLGASTANASLLLYQLTGVDSTKWTASFTLDTSRVASITLPTSVRYNGVPITFTRPNSTIVETASLTNTGPTFMTLNNQGGFYLGNLGGFPIGLSVFGPQLFSATTSAPVFLTGVFGLSDIPRDRTTDPLIVDYTLTVTKVAAVPEPASWAMMVGGFGLIGGAMRRRQRTAVRFA